ncbi:MAG: hypothetical protein K8T26_02185 [Lentisphaerae bacterium]|nr:hypothetical protein [Lentisphaerota bacterium]
MKITAWLGMGMGALLCAGCVSPVDVAVRQYAQMADQVRLGATESDVRALLDPVQARLDVTDRRRPDQYLLSGTNVTIYFARSGCQFDGLTTDDEFTPYVFHDGRLVAIGWTALGGPKTQGQARQDTMIQVMPTTEYYRRTR